MFDKYIVPVLDFRKKMCKEIVTTSTLNSVKNLCVLYDCLATVENGVGLLVLPFIFRIKSFYFPSTFLFNRESNFKIYETEVRKP